jgi:hypothetical protein
MGGSARQLDLRHRSLPSERVTHLIDFCVHGLIVDQSLPANLRITGSSHVGRQHIRQTSRAEAWG